MEVDVAAERAATAASKRQEERREEHVDEGEMVMDEEEDQLEGPEVEVEVEQDH